MARKYAKDRNGDWDDLIQAGLEGFLEACRRYDFREEAGLLTYAGWWVRHHIQHYIATEGSVVRFPINHYQKTPHHPKPRRSFRARYVRNFCEIPDFFTEDMEVAFEDTLISDEELAEDTLSDAEVAYWMPRIAEMLLGHLEPRNRDIMQRRFDENPETLEALGTQHGLSRERVRQIECECLNRLRDRAGLKMPVFKDEPSNQGLWFHAWLNRMVKQLEAQTQSSSSMSTSISSSAPVVSGSTSSLSPCGA